MRLFESLTREAHNDEERQLLTNTLLSRQQEKNEKIIHEQGRLIDTLNSRWQRLDNELAKANSKNRKKLNVFLNNLFKSKFVSLASWKETLERKLEKLKNENTRLKEEVTRAMTMNQKQKVVWLLKNKNKKRRSKQLIVLLFFIF